MQTMVPLYGFGGGSGGTGAALTVTAPAGATVTVSKDGKSKTKVADLDGVAVFKGLSSGDWLLSITDGTQTAQKTVTITTDYSTAITFFSATIHITYPAGSTCTATDGVTTIPAPDTSGTWDCVVPNAGTWTVSEDGIGISDTCDISTDGQEVSVDISKYWLYRAGYGAKVSIEALTQSASSVDIGTEAIVLKGKVGSNGCCGARSTNMIDLTKFKTLYCRSNCSGGSNTLQPYMIVTDVAYTAYPLVTSYAARLSIKGSELTTYSIDLSGISGSYYIGVQGQIIGSILDWWME